MVQIHADISHPVRLRGDMAIVELVAPRRRGPVVRWAYCHIAAVAVGGCVAFWATVGVALYFIL